MLLAQVGRAEWPFEQHPIVEFQQRVDVLGRGPTRHSADVEFELSLARPACHRIVAGGSAREREPSVLARRKGQRIGPVDDEPDTLDVVCGVLDRCHTAVQTAARMGWGLLVAAKPGDDRIRCRDRAAAEDQPLRLFLVREREAAVIEKIDLAADEARLTGPAPAGAAAMRIGNAVGGRRLQDCDALRHRDAASGLAYLDMFRHGALSQAVLDRPSATVRPGFCDRNVP